MAKDLYEILQVSPNAEPEVIESAYRRLAQKYHPDVNPSADATERMKQLNNAYDILRDPARRARYDAWRTRGTPPPRAESAGASATPKDSPPPPTTKTEPPHTTPPPRAPTYAKPPARSWSWLKTVVRIWVLLVVIGGVGRALFPGIPDYLAQQNTVRTNQSNTPIPTSAPIQAAQIVPTPTPSFPIGTPQAQQMQYACFSPTVDAFIYQNGQIVPSGLAYRNGDEIQVFGQVGDFYFVGVNEKQEAFYVKKSNVCAQRPLDYYSPTPTRLVQPTREATVSPARLYRISSQTAPTEWGVFHEMDNTRISICATTAEIRSGPSETYPVVSYMSIGDFATAYGWVGSWFYIGRDSNYHDYFVNNSFVCALNQSGATNNNSHPASNSQESATPVAGNPCKYPSDNSPESINTWLECSAPYWTRTAPETPYVYDAGPCDSFIYKQWASGKSTRYMPECTPTPRTP